MELMVYLLFDTFDVTFVPFTVSLLNLYPLLGEMVIVAEVPSFTVNDCVLLVMVVPSYDTEPPAPDWIDRE